jgi:hypothetical protein
MQAEVDRSELVRCAACHAIYEQAIVPAPPAGGAACPDCGDVAWLALEVPVEETAVPVPT